MKILIAEDSHSMRHALKTLFLKNGCAADAVENGPDALSYLLLGQYDAAVLDVMMPGMDGFEVVRRARKEGVSTPILFLTARTQVEDRVAGLDLGANDYLTKPFDIRELLARVRVLTRAESRQADASLSLGNVTLDTARFTLSAPGGSLTLNNKEYQCLLIFMQNPGVSFSPQTLLEKIWDPESAAGENTVWTVVYQLRKKLERLGADVAIRHHRFQGYCLEVIA